MLKMDPVTIRRYVRGGKLKGVKLGKDYRISKDYFIDFLKRVEKNPEILKRKSKQGETVMRKDLREREAKI